MHVAKQLGESLFRITVNGARATRADVFPDWHRYDRLGIVVHEPFGGVGASQLIQMSITAYYDTRPERRSTAESYPEMYVFHVGGRYGDHSPFDFWPPRKEIFVGEDAAVVVDMLNNHGITRLAVPNSAPKQWAELPWKERETAIDRLASAWLYSADGLVVNGDLTITGVDGPRTTSNARNTLDARRTFRQSERTFSKVLVETDQIREGRRWLKAFGNRLEEVPEATARAIAEGRESLNTAEGVCESYTRITPLDALDRLVP